MFSSIIFACLFVCLSYTRAVWEVSSHKPICFTLVMAGQSSSTTTGGTTNLIMYTYFQHTSLLASLSGLPSTYPVSSLLWLLSSQNSSAVYEVHLHKTVRHSCVWLLSIKIIFCDSSLLRHVSVFSVCFFHVIGTIVRSVKIPQSTYLVSCWHTFRSLPVWCYQE